MEVQSPTEAIEAIHELAMEQALDANDASRADREVAMLALRARLVELWASRRKSE